MRGVFLLALCAWLVFVPQAARAQDPELEHLDQALASSPDDPDLLWAKAMVLARLGRPAEAADLLDSFTSRWPTRRPDAAFQLGRLRYDAGQYEAALAPLLRAGRHGREPGPAYFYRGMALRALGRTGEATIDLQLAAHHEPELEAQTLLFAGLDSLDRDDPEKARELLLRAAWIDDTGEIARLATETLAGTPESTRDRPRRWSLSASAGFESDSNVTLESDQLPGSTTDESDDRWTLGAGFRFRPVVGDRFNLTLGYRYDQSGHKDLKAFDQRTHMPFVTASWRAHRRLSLRMDALYAGSQLDGERYARSVTGQPSLLIELGPRAGVLRIHGEATRRGFFEDPPFPSLDRSGTTFGGGLTHYVALPLTRGGIAALGTSWSRTRTDAGTDLLGFEGDYDRRRYEGSARLQVPLPRGFKGELSLVLAREPYENHNLVHALTDAGVGTAKPQRRRDTIFDGRVSLHYALTDYVDVEAAWRYSRQISNVDVYDYDRNVFGLYLKTEL